MASLCSLDRCEIVLGSIFSGTRFASSSTATPPSDDCEFVSGLEAVISLVASGESSLMSMTILLLLLCILEMGRVFLLVVIVTLNNKENWGVEKSFKA